MSRKIDFVPPGSRDGDLGHHLVRDAQWRKAYDDFRRKEGREPAVEDAAYYRALAQSARKRD